MKRRFIARVNRGGKRRTVRHTVVRTATKCRSRGSERMKADIEPVTEPVAVESIVHTL